MSRNGHFDARTLIPWGLTFALLGAVLLWMPTLVPPSVRSALGVGPERVLAARVVADQGVYAYLSHQRGEPGKPVGYDPCKVIHLRVNLKHAPPDGLDMVRTAMDRVGGATGLRFVFDGLTDARPKWHNQYVPSFLGQPRSRPVLISWATSVEVPELAGAVAGIGGSLPMSDRFGTLRYVTGGVTLDATAFEALDMTDEGRAQAMAIVLHEFGHLVGLAHVRDQTELMFADNMGVLDFAPGDLAGLARVGATSCA